MMTSLDLHGSTGQILGRFNDASKCLDLSYWFMNKAYQEPNEQMKKMYLAMEKMMKDDSLKHINDGIALIDHYRKHGINFHEQPDSGRTINPSNESVFRPDASSYGEAADTKMAG